jgi:PAS domain-containing protein
VAGTDDRDSIIGKLVEAQQVRALDEGHRRDSERAISEAERRLRSVVGALDEGVCVVQDALIRFVNDKLQRILERPEAALVDLVRSGRLIDEDGTLTSSNFVVPLGAEQGWEAAILHHFSTVAVAIAAKIRSGASGSDAGDRVGGSTFAFTVAPGHPLEERVYGLLRKVRADAQALWDEVSAHNATHPSETDASVKVSFYVGQTVEEQG